LATASLRAALSTFLAAFAAFIAFAALTRPAAGAYEWAGLAVLLAAGITGVAAFARRPDAERRVLSAVLDNMVEALSVHDKNTRLVAWNRRYAELMKMPAAMLAQHPTMEDIVRHQVHSGEFSDLGETEDARVAARIRQIPSVHKAFTYERSRPDGTWIEVRGIPLPGGGYIRTFVDTTERKRAEQKQAEQAALLDRIMQNIDQGIVVIDADDRMVAFNSRYAGMLELDEVFLAGQPTIEQVTAVLTERGEFDDQPIPVETTAPDWSAMLTRPGVHGLPKVYRRRRPNGAVLEFRNDPLSGGGSVRTITDVTERVRSEEALRASERMLSAVLDAVPIMVNLKDRDRRYVMVNRTTTELFGIDAKELLGRTSWPGRPESNVSLTSNRDQIAIDTGEPQTYTAPAGVDAEGRPRHWITSKTPVKDEQGRITHVVTASYDVSEIVRAGEAVKESERLLHAILDAVPISISVKDRDLNYRMVNRHLADVFGFDPKLAVGRQGWGWRGADDVRATHDRDHEVLTTGRPISYDAKDETPGGHRDLVTTKVPIADEAGQVRYIVTASYDVTERNRAADAVRKSERLLQAVIDAVPVSISVKDRDLKYLMVNRHLKQVFGFDSEEVIGRTAWGKRPQQEVAVTADRDREVLAAGSAVTFEEQDEMPAGRPELVTTKVPIPGDDGQVRYIVTASYDVTGLKRAEREVRRSEQQIRALLESSPVGVTMSRRDGTLKFWNARYAEYVRRLTTKPMDQVDVRDFYRNAADRDAVIAELKRRGRVRDVEIECLGLDGQPLWVSSLLEQIDFEGERVTLGWFYEVTELKEAERRLRESEQRLRMILESSPIAVSISKIGGGYIFVNQSIATLYGYSRGEAATINPASFYLNPADRVRLVEMLQREGRVSGVEIPLRRRDGSIFWALTFWQKVEIDGEPCIVSWLIDQTERHRAAGELASKTAILTATLENMDQGITMYDQDLRVIAWNRRFCELIGLSPEFLAANPTHVDIIRQAGPGEVGVEGEALERLAQEHAARIRATTQPRISVRRRPNGMVLETRTTPVAGGGFVRTYTDVTEIKAAERRVAESELRLRTILESSPVGVGITTPHGGRVFANRAFAEMYGLSHDEVMTTNALDFYVDPADRAPLIAQLEREGRVPGVELLQKRKDGTRFWCYTFWQRVGLAGEDSWVVWTFDLTERKRQAEELANKTAILTATLENMDQAIAMFDADHKMLAWNRRFLEGSKLPAEFFSGTKTYEEIVRHLGPAEYGLKSEEEIESFVQRHMAFLSTLTESHLNTHQRPDGRILDIRTTPMPGGGFVRTYTDVTELKLAERRLRESEIRLRTLLESSPLAVSLQTFSGKRLFVNQAFADLYGLTREGSLQADPHNYYANPEDRVRLVERLKKEDRVPGVEIEFRRHNDERFWAYMLWQRLTIDAEDSFVTWAHDVTERRRYQEELTQAKEAAEQASRAKSSFLAAMSHEIRTPMNGVLGLLELLQQSQLTTEQQEMATVIGESASSLLKIIDDILDFSKIEAGKLEVEHVPLALLTLVEGVAETLAPAARKKGLALVTYVDPAVPELVRGDPVRLRQILFNLIGNAIKFTEKGQVSVEVAGAGDSIGFKIVDTGVGLTPEAKSRLFQAFVQADDSTTRKFGGTGLGLSICKRLAERMGGSIEVESEFGRGSIFEVRLPLPAEPSDATEKRVLDGVAVLVVEDDPTMRSVLARYLGAEGAIVEWVDSAEAALVRLAARRKPKPDALVIDYKLPGIDGFALRRAVADQKRLAGTGMVLLTAYDDRGQRRRALEAGFRAYLTKPVRRAVLVRAMEIALGRAEAEDQRGDEVPALADTPADGNCIFGKPSG
jgi:PAS domain S-box-containing protein